MAGEILSLFATGLGPVSPAVDLGQPFPSSPVATVNSPIEVMVNGKAAEVLGAVGLPGAVDGYQVNFRVPPDTAKGPASIQVSAAWIVRNCGGDRGSVNVGLTGAERRSCRVQFPARRGDGESQKVILREPRSSTARTISWTYGRHVVESAMRGGRLLVNGSFSNPHLLGTNPVAPQSPARRSHSPSGA